jgi:hypothetical protein
MYIAIVTDALDDGSPLVITNEEDEPETFVRLSDIQELKEDHMLMACDWWAFDCETGKATLLDA